MNDEKNVMMRIATLYRYELRLPVMYVDDLQAVPVLENCVSCMEKTRKTKKKK